MQVFQAVSSYMSAYDKVIFNPTTHLSHVERINKEAMAGAVRRSKLVLAALSEGFFASKWCEAEIEAAREAGIKVIPCYSGDDYGATRSMLMRAHRAASRACDLGRYLGAYCWHGRGEAPGRLWAQCLLQYCYTRARRQRSLYWQARGSARVLTHYLPLNRQNKWTRGWLSTSRTRTLSTSSARTRATCSTSKTQSR